MMALFGKQLTISGDGFAVFHTARAPASNGDNPARGAPNGGQGAINLDNILKLIPGDVVSLFMTGTGLSIGSAAAGPQAAVTPAPIAFGLSWPAMCFYICLAVCLLLRIFASQPVGASNLSDVNWGLVIVTGVAFFVWAHAVSPVGPIFAAFHGAVAGFVAMVLGVLAPLAAKQS